MIKAIRHLRIEDFAKSDFPLAAHSRPITNKGNPHNHDFFELIFIRRGGGVHVIRDRPYPMLNGDIYLIHPHDIHEYQDVEDQSSLVNILFNESIFSHEFWQELRAMPGLETLFSTNPSTACPKIALTPFESRLIERQCDQLIEECEHQTLGWQVSARALFSDLLVRIARASHSLTQTSDEDASEPISQALHHITNNWDQPISVTKLAAEAGYSANWFGERFRSQVGLTVQAYQAKLRIDHARVMLEESRSSITDIALNCGFDDPSYFGRVFKKITGITPRAYRKMINAPRQGPRAYNPPKQSA